MWWSSAIFAGEGDGRRGPYFDLSPLPLYIVYNEQDTYSAYRTNLRAGTQEPATTRQQ